VFLSWKLFQYDYPDIGFNVLKNGEKINPAVLGPGYTDYLDPEGSAGDTYQIEVLSGGRKTALSEEAGVWAKDYFAISLKKPVGRLWNGTSFTGYTDYDCMDGTAADLDGDGNLDLVFFWVPANQQDNSISGITGTVFIDAYTLNGKKLWGEGKFIDLGPNIRAGAHYRTFVVDDFDGDGKAEIAVKTAPGTIDTQGTPVDSVNKDKVYINASGYILAGPEYLSIFEGSTGKLLDTTDYIPSRGISDNDTAALNTLWGDNYGNRVDRFLSCAARLDGVRSSIVMCRGYYTRTGLTAYDWDGTQLKVRWTFDTRTDPKGPENQYPWDGFYEGQGNHNLTVADVDGDGADEIVYGSLTIDHDGTPLYTTRLGHGDALHVGDLDPERPGLEVVSVHESSPYGIEMHDAATGAILWRTTASADTGRGITADIDPEFPGEESWCTLNGVNIGIHSADGLQRSSGPLASCNMAIYWDGDTGRELFDGGYEEPAVIQKGSKMSQGVYALQPLKEFPGTKTSAGTKRNPFLQADILGDWREELILSSADSREIRIYTTTIPTVHEGSGKVPDKGIPALMDNHQYRMSIIWQHTGYNQPPHTSWFIGYNMADIRR
ncbi:MAG: rhamnogalacturonan lyase, partial [Spirochaetaceae bacterium]|nr:rhamnogalacturonan lyase [Spirochaetaceae bacterium]